MAFDSLRDFLGSLERMGELKHIKAEVDPVHELGAIAYHSLLKKGPALLFDNVKGHKTPLVTNVLVHGPQIAVALGIEGDMQSMFEKFLSGFKNPIVPSKSKPARAKRKFTKTTPWISPSFRRRFGMKKTPVPISAPFMAALPGSCHRRSEHGHVSPAGERQENSVDVDPSGWVGALSSIRRGKRADADGRRHRHGTAAVYRVHEPDQFGTGASCRVRLRRRAARQAGGAHQVRDFGSARSRASGDRA